MKVSKKIHDFCREYLGDIIRPIAAIAIKEYDSEQRAMVQIDIDDVQYCNDGITVEITIPNSSPPNVHEFDWDDRHEIEEVVTILKQQGFNEEEVKEFSFFTNLPIPEEIVLKVFEAPVEEFLTHENPQVREAGKKLNNS